MARLPGFAQGVVALDIGLRLGGERQGARRLHGGASIGLPSTRRCSRFRICVLVGAPASSASSTAVSTACSSCWRTSARISTISRSPPGVLSMRCCRARKAGGSSANGAPLRKAPGLR